MLVGIRADWCCAIQCHAQFTSSGAFDDSQYNVEDVLKGWAIPTATDIPLAWCAALLTFGQGHPAINYLLLLAVVDDVFSTCA